MKTWEIIYYMHPDPNITIRVKAKDEDMAIEFAKNHRKDSFSVREVE